MENEIAHSWMRDIETASRERLREIQLFKLKKMLGYVDRRSKFYKEKFSREKLSPSALRTLDDLRRLPFTTRDEIVADQEKNGRMGTLMATEFTDPGQSVGLTGVKFSASGQPVRVIISIADAAFQGKLAARGLTCAGVTSDDYLYVADFPQFNLLYMNLGLGSINLGSKSLLVGMERAERNATIFPSLYPPSAYYITPSYAKFVLPLLKKAGKKHPIRTVVGWSEPGYSLPTWRRRFEEKWAEVSSEPDVKVCDAYGMVEVGFLGFECRQQKGLHGFEDAYIYEVINPETGSPLAPGEEGELVVTHLERFGMPLIRYRTGDITSIDDLPCACGRTHLRLQGIEGRYSERLEIVGKRIYGSQVEEIIGGFHEYGGDFNILVDGSRAIERLQVALTGEEASPGLQSAMQEQLAKKLGVPVQVVPVERDDLLIFPHRSVKIIDGRRVESLRKEVKDQLKVEA